MTASHFPAYTENTANAGQTANAGRTVDAERPDHLEHPVVSVRTAGRLPSRRQGIGWICLALATALWVRVSAGASAIAGIISEYEAANGPLDLSAGYVQHQTPEIVALCDELVSTAGYFYPFAWLVLVAVAALWGLCCVMALAPGAPRLLAISAVAAAVVLVVQLVRFAEPIYQMTIITE